MFARVGLTRACIYADTRRVTLKRYLERNRLSVEEFAKMVGVHNTTLYRYLNGTAAPTATTLKAIVDATDGAVTADELLAEMSKAS